MSEVSQCPNCGVDMEFYEGEQASYDNPGTCAFMCCPECGYDREPTDEDFVDFGPDDDFDDEFLIEDDDEDGDDDEW